MWGYLSVKKDNNVLQSVKWHRGALSLLPLNGSALSVFRLEAESWLSCLPTLTPSGI